MKKALVVWSVVLTLAASASAQKRRAGEDAALGALVQAERSFAQTSVAKGMREAFLSFLADDALIFRPGPVNAKEAWLARKEAPGVLSWEPVFADVSRAGDLGYTTGPWEFREKSLADKPVAHGNYVTLWRRQPDGSYKFVLDFGTDNPPPDGPAPSLHFGEQQKIKTKPGTKVDIAAEASALRQADAAYAAEAKSDGIVKAFLKHSARDVRLHRQHSFPVAGREAARAALAANPGTLEWQPAAAHVADSADLGYTYGTYEFKPTAADKPAERGHYLKIWKRQPDGTWLVALDLMRPLPPPRPAAN